jgi:hypothetical protein
MNALAFDVARVVAVAVLALDLPIAAVDHEFSLGADCLVTPASDWV